MPLNSFLSLPPGTGGAPTTQYYDPSGNLVQGDINTAISASRRRWDAEVRQRQSAAWRRKAFRTAAAGAAMFGGAAAIGAAGGGGGIAGMPAGYVPGWEGSMSIIGGAAPAATGGATAAIGSGATRGALSGLSSIFSNPGFEVATNAGLGIAGMVTQNRANSRARLDALAREERMLALERERLALEARNADLDREDQRALNAAMQENERRRFALEQERFRFERDIFEQDRAYREPFRRTQELARQRLSAILGLG